MPKRTRKYVYFFGGGKAEGKAQMKELLGGKGANLAEMSSLGLPVPPGFTLTTEACAQYDQQGEQWPTGLDKQVEADLARLEKLTAKTFGHGENPLLVSVRSGAAVSMPGMMDTVLNLGLNDQTLQALIKLTGNERFAWDAYRRFMQMFGDVVLGMEHEHFEEALQAVKHRRGVKLDTELDVDGLKEVVEGYRQVYRRDGKAFPQDARAQLADSINAVFGSWNNERAIKYRQLNEIRGLLGTLEEHYRDMQDIEFTIERGELFMLQTRTGKRTAAAAVKIANDMMKQGLIDEREALLRVEPQAIDQLLHPTFDPKAEEAAEQIGTGLPASPGAATGQIVFSAADAEAAAEEGNAVVLCRIETSPEDIGGMHAARGILTSRGGMTSHAAVVARGMGKCCVAGCGKITISYQAKTLSADGRVLSEGDWISLNGSTGTVYAGKIETTEPALTGPFGQIMKLADKYRRLGIRTNADTPKDTEVAVRFGAEGIGLCRTEHMFFEGDRIVAMREMILAESLEGREKALAKLLPLQRGDFVGIFKALKGRPATIRLLDPPLHEFLPHDQAGQQEMAEVMDVPAEKIKSLVDSMHEFNPMLGLRGCRLGITFPEITAMQARAIIEAAYDVPGAKAEIMVPLIGHVKEFVHQKRIIEEVLAEVKSERKGRKVPEIKIGTMIEVPRGALTADEVAAEAEFFSFGTNDLTQMGCGFSRDDAGKFLSNYVELGIYQRDPFQSLDTSGVGELIRIAVQKGRAARRNLKLGICGEHGGDPASIAFCHEVGLDYVSCSPYRVPVARLAAAQAVIAQAGAKKAKKVKKAKKTKKARKAVKKAAKSAKKVTKSAKKVAKKAVKRTAKKAVKKATKKTRRTRR